MKIHNQKNLVILVILVLGQFPILGQTNWYVDQVNGTNTSSSGTSPSNAFKTVEYAVKPNNNFVQPGDFVNIIGEYHNTSYDPNFTFDNSLVNPGNPTDLRRNGITDIHIWHGENTIRLNKIHGTHDGGYITFRPYDSNTVLKGDGANIFRIQNCSYLRIEGFDIEGEVDRIPLETAFYLQFIYINSSSTITKLNAAGTGDTTNLVPALNTVNEVVNYLPFNDSVYYRVPPHWDDNMIDSNNVSNGGPGWILLPNITRPSYTSTRGIYVSNAHHIDVVNNIIHHLPGGGLRFSETAYYNAIGNEIHNCSRRSYGGTHALVGTKAISKAKKVPISGNGDDDAEYPEDDLNYRIKIIGNEVHHNYNEVYSWAPSKTIITPHLDEGKGISMQRNLNNNSNAPWNLGRILIANNICYWNGFSGVHTNDGLRLDFINNTCFMNSYTNTITYAPNGTGGNIGISSSSSDDIVIKNNISVIDRDLNKFAISADPASTNLTVKDNVIWSLGSGPESDFQQDPEIVAVEVNTIIANPLLTDAPTAYNPPSYNFDFHVMAGSPAIDAADTTCAPFDDFYNIVRDETPTIGAIEYLDPLPITLSKFFVESKDGKIVYLNWTTLAEWNNDFFIIEKSKDGVLWHDMLKVPSRGNSELRNDYMEIDRKPFYGMNYYRIKQTDFDGAYTYSDVRSVRINTFGNINIYPNPSAGITLIKSTVDELSQLGIFNVLGQNVTSLVEKHIIDRNNLKLDFIHLPQGIYYIKTNSQISSFIKE